MTKGIVFGGDLCLRRVTSSPSQTLRRRQTPRNGIRRAYAWHRAANLAWARGDPLEVVWLLVVIRICAWIPVYHFLHHWWIGNFLTFVSISLFSQFSYNQQPIWTKLGEMNDADECIHSFGTDIQRTSKSRLIRKSEFESGSLLFQILASAEVCTIYYRQHIFN